MAWTFYNSSGEAMIIDGGLANVVEDTTPQLGANLDMNDFGLAFPATQSADAGANVLDDYEEGTWTPTLQDDSRSDSESQAYSEQVGSYTKIGRLVNILCRITVTSLGTLTTSEGAVIGGLPFTAANPGGHLFWGMAPGTAGGLAITSGTSIGGSVRDNTAVIGLHLWDATTGTSGLLVSEVSADGQMHLSGSYEAA